RQDPNSSNLRKPFLDARDKVVSSSASGLLCPFNAGTTTVTVKAGGFSFSERLRIQKGSVQRPCGTRPLRADRFQRQPVPVPVAPPAPVGPAPANDPPPSFQPPPPAPVPAPPPAIPAIVPPPVRPTPRLPIPQAAAFELPFVATQAASLGVPPTPPPPPVPPAARPTPPGGAPARVAQVEKEREEQAAPEQSQAFSRYQPEEDSGLPPYLLGLVLIAALAGAGVRGSGGSRMRATPAPVDSGAPYDHEGEPPSW
ncbi:MAG: hypothetical protein WKF32_04455, partial [Thermoleophilaceae bacterium]